MKKKLALLLSSVMLLGSAYGFVGCGEEQSTQTPGGETPGGGDVPVSTEERIFSTVKTGITNFINYDGSMTGNTSVAMDLEMPMEGIVQKMEANNLISYDVDGEKAYWSSTTTESTYSKSAEEDGELIPMMVSVDKNTRKLYKTDGVYYSYEEGLETENSETTYENVEFIKDNGESFAEFKQDQMMSGTTQEEMETVFGAVAIANSFAELKTAYETVYTQQLTAQKAIDETATATAVVSATETDGVMTLSIQTNAKSIDAQMGIVEQSSTMTVEIKDGALSKITATQSEKILMEMEGEQVVMASMSLANTMTYTQAFDTAGFNAIVVDSSLTPEDNTQKTTVLHELVFYLFYKHGAGFVGAPTDTLANAMGNFFDSYNNDAYTVSWYLDEEYTTPADFTAIKLGDSDATTVYAKITVNEGYAQFYVHGTTRDDRSRDYKIAFSSSLGMMLGGSVGMDMTYSREISTTERNEEVLTSEGKEIWVNGAKVGENTYTLTFESGTYYKVEYVDAITDAEYSIFASQFFAQMN